MRVYLESGQFQTIRSEIEDRAYDFGCIDLNVLQYAAENKMISSDEIGDSYITGEDLQEIASIFSDVDIKAV